MTTNITHSLNRSGHLTEYSYTWTTLALVPKAEIPVGTPYEHGVRFHGLLNRIADSRRLNATERSYLPYLNAVRDELRAHGVDYITPEFSLASCGEIAAGRCDMLLQGGLTDVGVNEIKCVAKIPDAARPEHVRQLTRYATQISMATGQPNVWGCVCYLSVPGRRLRFFVFRDAKNCGASAPTLLAA